MGFVLRGMMGLLVFLWVYAAASLAAGEPAAKSITAEDGRYQVNLTGAGEPWFDPKTGGRVKFAFSVIDKVNDRRYPIYLDNVTSKVNEIRISKGKMVVFGEEATLHFAVTTVINLENRQEIDSFIGFGSTLSETGRFLSFRKFYPPETAEPATMSDLVLVYDLNDSANENRLRGEDAYKHDPMGRLVEVGHPIYPEGHAGKKNYRVWVRDENRRHTVIPNGFFWLDHDHKIAFGDQIGGENYLIVVDLSDGLTRPLIHKVGINVLSLLKPEDRQNESLFQEAKRLGLESVEDLKNGKVRIRVSSPVRLQDNSLELSLEESAPAAAF